MWIPLRALSVDQRETPRSRRRGVLVHSESKKVAESTHTTETVVSPKFCKPTKSPSRDKKLESCTGPQWSRSPQGVFKVTCRRSHAETRTRNAKILQYDVGPTKKFMIANLHIEWRYFGETLSDWCTHYPQNFRIRTVAQN